LFDIVFYGSFLHLKPFSGKQQEVIAICDLVV